MSIKNGLNFRTCFKVEMKVEFSKHFHFHNWHAHFGSFSIIRVLVFLNYEKHLMFLKNSQFSGNFLKNVLTTMFSLSIPIFQISKMKNSPHPVYQTSPKLLRYSDYCSHSWLKITKWKLQICLSLHYRSTNLVLRISICIKHSKWHNSPRISNITPHQIFTCSPRFN